jgi:hypothetical protein
VKFFPPVILPSFSAAMVGSAFAALNPENQTSKPENER